MSSLLSGQLSCSANHLGVLDMTVCDRLGWHVSIIVAAVVVVVVVAEEYCIVN